MAKVKVNFDDKTFTLRVQQVFQRVKQSKDLQTEIGKFVSERIKGEAKRGTPLNKSRSFPSLKPATVAERKRLSQFNPTGSPFRPGFSNTTLTGQVLDSIDFKAQKNVVLVGPTGKRTPYITGSSGNRQKLKRGVNATNQDVANRLDDIGFVIFDADVVAKETKIVSRIKNITLRFLRRALRVAELTGK